ncbi:MAG TPA: hypothetical protein ENJ99_06700 [Rhizobiales bacterium]|nr:hypothetical protein [Hyphomicrobiales bacterium]
MARLAAPAKPGSISVTTMLVSHAALSGLFSGRSTRAQPPPGARSWHHSSPILARTARLRL